LEHLKAVLSTLQRNEFFANIKKCSSGKTKIEYLGHMISGVGVAVDKKKVQAVLNWPIPKTVKALRGFLGLAGYYRRFICGFGKIARPLNNMLKARNFKWTTKSSEAFKRLQEALTSAPVLTMPDFDQPFVIKCDASEKGIGVVLSQNKKAIAYFSKPLSEVYLVKSI